MDSHITETLLFERVGPAPTIKEVAAFLREQKATTWRRVKRGELLCVKGDGTMRIGLRSLCQFLNSEEKEVRYRKGPKKLGAGGGVLNSREFLTQALLSSHRVILDKLLADVDITEANEDVHQELSEQAAGIADTYAGTLMLQWRSLMGFSEHCDREHLEEGEESSTENLTRPSVAPLN